MNGLDPSRVALVVGSARRGSRGAGAREQVGTGYFLTGDLVLTARHVVDGVDDVQVRVEGADREDQLWRSAEHMWSGVGDVDAALVRLEKPVASWTPPVFVVDEEEGDWVSSGYAAGAVADLANDRKTLPLDGAFNLSRGQGPIELSLQTTDARAAGWDGARAGVSGAPVFLDHPTRSGLLGIITEDARASTNRMIGMPIARLLDDVRFRTSVTPSFLGALPAKPWCLVLAAEGVGIDLIGEVQDVLARDQHGDRLLEDATGGVIHEHPVAVTLTDALASVENWARAVEALARADFVVADVTGFQPAMMLMMGVRAVLRRGVTLSVTSEPVVGATAALPFNVQETKVISLADDDFQSKLHAGLADGAIGLRRDANYLDLPAFYAVRAPRPDNWLTDDQKAMLVLCPFTTEYTGLFVRRLGTILESYSGMTPTRMLDLVSPRLVGQALYEQIRWATVCVVDWSGWRPNVFFEHGVRLACSPHDPLLILQSDEVDGPRDDGDDRSARPRTLEQHTLLGQLFRPVSYDRQQPRATLATYIDEATRRPRVETRPYMAGALPPRTTYDAARSSYIWQDDRSLVRPDVEQRRVAHSVFGRDPIQYPERLILYGDNVAFDHELRDAMREKWIASWLYLRHATSGDDSPAVRTELMDLGPLVVQALEGSDDPRHRRVVGDIRKVLETLDATNVDLDRVLALKAQAKTARADAEYEAAISFLEEAVETLRELAPTATHRSLGQLDAEFADCFGMMGGIWRRRGLSASSPTREEHLREAVRAYYEGYRYESELDAIQPSSYNRVNRLVVRILLEPDLLRGSTEASVDLLTDVREADQVLEQQVAGPRLGDPWAFADLGMVRLLEGAVPARLAFRELDQLQPQPFVYESTVETVGPLAEVAADVRPELVVARELLSRSAATARART